MAGILDRIKGLFGGNGDQAETTEGETAGAGTMDKVKDVAEKVPPQVKETSAKVVEKTKETGGKVAEAAKAREPNEERPTNGLFAQAVQHCSNAKDQVDRCEADGSAF